LCFRFLDRKGDGHRFDCLDQPGRRQSGRDGLDRLGGFLGRRTLLPFHDRRFGEHVAAGERDVALTRKPVDELPRDHLLDGARRTLDVNAVIAFEQSGDFLARGAEQFSDFVNPNSCQRVTSNFRRVAARAYCPS
jgi:hypothetical protein